MPLLKIPFSRLFAVASAALFLFVGLTVAVNYFGMFQSLDNSILQFIYAARGPILTQIFLAFTFFGTPTLIFLITLTLGVFLFYKKEFGYFFLFFGTVAASSLFWMLLKILTHRERPSLPLIQETSFSFPSGHATLSVAFFGLIAYLAASFFKTRSARINIFFIWFFLVIGIGLSRLYLGVHYPTDVLAGYLAGLFSLCIGIELFERLAQKNS